MVVNEKSKGSASLMLTKNLSRSAFLLAKYTAAALVWTAVYACGALVCQGYTLWFFPGGTAANLLPAFASYWLYGLALLALTLLASTLANGFGIAALGAFAGWGILLLSMIPAGMARYSPAVLGAANVPVISGILPAVDLWIPAAAAIGLIALALGLASWSLTKQEL
jgi:ABC-2 type transport system permease protein